MAEIQIEVPSYAEHALTGNYGAVLTSYRGHEYRVEWPKRGAQKMYRDGEQVLDIPDRVKIRAVDGYLNYLKPAFSDGISRSGRKMASKGMK